MSSLTTKILIEIRDEIRSTNTRLDATNTRLDSMDTELHSTTSEMRSMNTRLDTHEQLLVRLVDLSQRHEHAIGKLVTSVDSLNGRFDNFLTGAHKTAHDEDRRRVDDLDTRVTRLEGKKPGGRRAG